MDFYPTNFFLPFRVLIYFNLDIRNWMCYNFQFFFLISFYIENNNMNLGYGRMDTSADLFFKT